ncbi:hypothetical protein D6D01_05964 [Aureobasidium pullulans]|uniref:DUF1772-domain-containing protein n=1 Tax=Aureobasidium pullulans TaxID=5580 RepID=A0A4S9L313_AURPU|nr:hypothetical protein D6D01_05964 [Aureobasidium pullulans]
MDTTTAISIAEIIGPTVSIATAGAIISISALYTPLLSSSARSQESSKPNPASTLPAIRFIFSRGSHFFPQAAVFAAANLGFLAYHSPAGQVVKVLATEITRRNGLILAAALSMAIGPITGIMLPICNNPLREMAELERQGREKEIDEAELKKMVKRFEWLNYLRGVPILVGGMLGLAVIAG